MYYTQVHIIADSKKCIFALHITYITIYRIDTQNDRISKNVILRKKLFEAKVSCEGDK